MLKRLLARPIWQGMVLVVMLALALLHTVDNAYPSAHALCPFGALGSLYSLVTTGTFVHRVHASALFLLLAVVLTALLAGRVFCGWLCPLGTLSEWVNRTGRRLGIKRSARIPQSVDRKLRYLKYVVLLVLLGLTWWTGLLVYRGWCPWSAFMHLFEPGELIADVLMGGIILLVTLGAALFIERFFCKYLCPFGAVLTSSNRLSLIKPVRAETCRGCQQCQRSCPMGIDITGGMAINSAECIRCYRCLERCPDAGSLGFNFRWLKPHLVGLLVVLIVAGTVWGSLQAGWWERGRSPAWMSGQGDGAGATQLPLELGELKASATLGEVAAATGLSLEEVYRVCRIPEHISPGATIREVSVIIGMTRGQMLKAWSAVAP